MVPIRGWVSRKKTEPPGHPYSGCPSGPRALRGARSRTYSAVTALVPTPPPADFTQTVVGRWAVTPRNAQRPSAALTLVVAMRAPGHVVPTAPPLWISTLAAKPPPVIRELVPSTRRSPVLRTCSARWTLTVSVAPGEGAGAAAFTTCVTAAEVLAEKSRLPL